MSGVFEKLLSELDSILVQIREVKAGDIILSEDHNNVKKALEKIREILENIKSTVVPVSASGVDPRYALVYICSSVDEDFCEYLYDAFGLEQRW